MNRAHYVCRNSKANSYCEAVTFNNWIITKRKVPQSSMSSFQWAVGTLAEDSFHGRSESTRGFCRRLIPEEISLHVSISRVKGWTRRWTFVSPLSVFLRVSHFFFIPPLFFSLFVPELNLMACERFNSAIISRTKGSAAQLEPPSTAGISL